MLYDTLLSWTRAIGMDKLRFESWLAEIGGLVATCSSGLASVINACRYFA